MVRFNANNYYSNFEHCISQNPCDILNTEVEFVPFISEASNQITNISLFTPYEIKSKDSKFELDSSVLKNIKNNKYTIINSSLPKSDGTTQSVEFKLSQHSNNDIMMSFQGHSNTISKEKTLLTTYEVKLGKKTIGSVGFSNNEIYGLYSFDDGITATKLIKSEEKNVFEASESILSGGPSSFTCTVDSLGGNFTVIDGKYDHEHYPSLTPSTGHSHNMMSNTMSGETSNLSVNDLQLTISDPSTYYSIDLVYDIPYHTFIEMQNNSVLPQIFVEEQCLYLNAFFNPSFNDSVKFNVKAAVVWTYQDPFNMFGVSWGTSAGDYADDVGIYYRDNHNTLLPNLNYDLVVQINSGTYPNQNYNGIVSSLWGLYYPTLELDNKYSNVAVIWKFDISQSFTFSGTPQNLFDNYVVAHEIGHLVLGTHTFDDRESFGDYSSTPLTDCGCNPCCVSNSDCYTIMSYCMNFAVYNPELGIDPEIHPMLFKFSPERINDFYVNAEIHGQHLLKDKILESYFVISISETYLLENNYKYTVEYKNCSGTEWIVYNTGYTYFDFDLLIPESQIPTFDCYDFRVTVDGTSGYSENRIYPFIDPSSTPTPTPTVTLGLTPTPTPLPSQTPSSTPPPTPTPSTTPIPNSDIPDPDYNTQSKWFIPCNEELETYNGPMWQIIISDGGGFGVITNTVTPYYADYGTIVSVIEYNAPLTFNNNPDYYFTEFCFKSVDFYLVPGTETDAIYFTNTNYINGSFDKLHIVSDCNDYLCFLPTPTPTNTVTPTNTPTPTQTASKGYIPPTPTNTPTNSTTPTVTPTTTITPSVTPSITPTNTVTPSITPSNLEYKTIFVHYPNL
jgi:hypothetical protein